MDGEKYECFADALPQCGGVIAYLACEYWRAISRLPVDRARDRFPKARIRPRRRSCRDLGPVTNSRTPNRASIRETTPRCSPVDQRGESSRASNAVTPASTSWSSFARASSRTTSRSAEEALCQAPTSAVGSSFRAFSASPAQAGVRTAGMVESRRRRTVGERPDSLASIRTLSSDSPIDFSADENSLRTREPKPDVGLGVHVVAEPHDHAMTTPVQVADFPFDSGVVNDCHPQGGIARAEPLHGFRSVEDQRTGSRFIRVGFDRPEETGQERKRLVPGVGGHDERSCRRFGQPLPGIGRRTPEPTDRRAPERGPDRKFRPSRPSIGRASGSH